MSASINAIAPVFLIIAIGYLMFRFAVVGESVWSAIEHVCFYLLLPALILRTLARADLGDIPLVDFAGVLLTAVLAMAMVLIGSHALVWQRYPDSGPSFSSVFQGATRFHGFVAIAVIGPLYGDEGLALGALAIAVLVPILNISSVLVLSIYGRSASRPEATAVVKRILTNPLILACLTGLLFNWTGLPDIIFDTIDIIGAGGLGLALLAVGAGMKPAHAARHPGLVALGVAVRLIGMPLVIIGMSALLGLDGLPRTIAIIAGAVPTAGSAYVMARKMGGDAELMSSIVTFQVFAAFFTLPLFIYVADRL